MDRQTATEYHADLRQRMAQVARRRASPIWILIAALIGYFAFPGISGAVWGAMNGLFFFVILFQIEENRIQSLRTEFIRHLFEHTDLAEEGEALYKSKTDIETAMQDAVKPWWMIW
jgi:uncharacterized membrane protein YtjA (UPF0391 family)